MNTLLLQSQHTLGRASIMKRQIVKSKLSPHHPVVSSQVIAIYDPSVDNKTDLRSS
ncbi:hypothetical protein C1H46_045535 [Malus baccata]|uniref:Uncharacterized protein n=1 Tax=Malus baccata TaxID=106549 RepID=A0A540K4X0_MALBA|nr:hypothetical protein C1H46_045535 [Malus baccata]